MGRWKEEARLDDAEAEGVFGEGAEAVDAELEALGEQVEVSGGGGVGFCRALLSSGATEERG